MYSLYPIFEDAVLSLVPAKPLPTSQNPEIQQAEDYGSKLSIDLSGAKNIKLGVLFTPLEEGQTGADEDFQLVSIGDWGKAEEEHAAGSGGSSAGGGSGAAAAAAVQTDSDAEIMHNVIALYINSPLAYRNGERLYIDSGNEAIVPMLEDGRTLVPLRFIAESLGAQVQWDQEENAACITYHNSSLVFVIDSKYYTKNGRAYPLDTAARLYGDRTYVPVRAVMEAFGKHVAWNDGLVTVSSYASIGENQHVIESLTQKLAYRLYVNGAEIGFFDLDQPICDVVISPGRTEPSVILLKSMNPNAAVHVVQPSGVSGSGTVAVDGKEVQVRISVDPYYYAAGEWGLASINVTNAAFKDMTGIVTWLQPLSVTASAEGAGAAEGICDNSLDTFWSSQGANTVDFDMGEEKNITSVAVSGDHKDGTRRYRFSILYSNDGIHWETAAEDLETTGPADDPELFELENFRARYIRFSAQGNTVNEWNIFYEVRFYESDEQAKQDEQNWEDYFARIDWDGFKTGDALRLAVSAVCNNGETVVFQAEDVLCTSDRADVIMTDGTLLQAVGAGMANITVTVDYHGIKEHVNIAVQVTE